MSKFLTVIALAFFASFVLLAGPSKAWASSNSVPQGSAEVTEECQKPDGNKKCHPDGKKKECSSGRECRKERHSNCQEKNKGCDREKKFEHKNKECHEKKADCREKDHRCDEKCECENGNKPWEKKDEWQNDNTNENTNTNTSTNTNSNAVTVDSKPVMTQAQNVTVPVSTGDSDTATDERLSDDSVSETVAQTVPAEDQALSEVGLADESGVGGAADSLPGTGGNVFGLLGLFGGSAGILYLDNFLKAK